MTKASGRAPRKRPRQAPAAEQKASARQVLRDLGALTVQTYQLSRGLGPLLKLLRHDQDVHREQLTAAMDRLFDGLYAHPVTRSTEKVTGYLRARKLIPNEQSTEELIRFVVEQLVQRSPVPVPDALVATAQQQASTVTKSLGAQLVWPGLLRMLDRRDASYRE